MSVVVAEGVVKVTADAKAVGDDLERGIKGAESKAESGGRGFGNRMLGGIGKVFAGGALAVGAVAIGGIGTALTKGFSRLNAIDQAKAKLQGLGNSAGQIDKIMTNALASVKGTAFGLDEAGTTAASAVAAGIKPGAQLEGVLKTIADTATIAGASMSDTGAIFNSVAARGKLQGDDLMQLQERGVPVLAFLAKHYGVTAAAASDMVSKGQVDFANFSAAMQENLGGAALSSGKTFTGAMSNFFASLGRIGAGLLGGVFPALAPAITSVTQAMAPLETLAGKIGQSIGQVVAPAIENFSKGIGSIGSTIGPALSPVIGLISSFLSPIMAAFAPLLQIGMQLWQALSPVSLVFAALQQAGAPLMIALQGMAIALGDGLVSALSAVLPAVQQLSAVLSGALAQVIPMLVPIITQLSSVFMALAPVIGQILAAILPLATSLISMLVPIIMQLVSAVLPPLVSIFQMLVPAIMPVVQALLGLLMPAIQMLMPIIQTVFAAIVPIITAAMQIIQGVIQVVTGIITGNWSQVWNGIKNIVMGVWNAIKAVITGALSIISAVIGAGLSVIKAVFSAAWNAIKTVVTAAIGLIVAVIRLQFNVARAIVTGVVNGIRAAISAGFNAARAVATAAINGIVNAARAMASGVGSAVSSAVSFFTGLGGKIKGAVSGFGSLLVSVGRNVIQGFINGAKSMGNAILNAVAAPIKGAISAAKGLLGIKSPSRVFRQIGIYVGQGLERGLHGSVAGVKSATRSLTNAVISEFEKQDKVRAKARATIAALSAGNNPLRKTAAGRAKIAADMAAANRIIASQPITQSQLNSTLATIGRASDRFQTLTTRQAKYTSQIKSATKALANVRSEQAKFQKSIVDNFSKLDITKIASGVGGANVVDALKAQLSDTKAYTATLAKLRKAGLDNTSYRQFISAGIDALPQAQELLAGGKGRIKQVASLQKQLGSATQSFAASSAKQLYSAGVQAAQGIIRGLQSQQSALTRQMRQIATTLTSTIKRQLGIHSPSRVFRDEVGAMLGQGVAVGFSMEKRGIVRAVRGTITDAMPSSMAMRAQGAAAVPAQTVDSSKKMDVTINEARDPLGTLGRLSYAWDTMGRTA